MYYEVKVKWFCPSHNIGITADRKTYLITSGRPILLKAHYHQGQVKYYLPSGKRISQRQINQDCVKQEKIIREFMPF